MLYEYVVPIALKEAGLALIRAYSRVLLRETWNLLRANRIVVLRLEPISAESLGIRVEIVVLDALEVDGVLHEAIFV